MLAVVELASSVFILLVIGKTEVGMGLEIKWCKSYHSASIKYFKKKEE